MPSFSRNDVDFTDSSDSFKKNGAYLEIQDTRGNSFGSIGDDGENKIQFKAFLTSLQDNFTSNWNSEEVYGRMDPIHTFQNTIREISISLTIPSVSYAEGIDNLNRMQHLERLMYPNYETNKGITTITEAPVFKVKFANLIQDAKTGEGLHCVIPSVSFNPNVEMGFYADNTQKFKQLVPKEMSLDLTLKVLHMHELGWDNKKFAGAPNFPQKSKASGMGIQDTSSTLEKSVVTSKIKEKVKVAEILSQDQILNIRGRE